MKDYNSILEDQFGRQHRHLRISLTERCNLSCTYCMPEEGIVVTTKEQLMQADEIMELAKIFVQNGVNKIRLTGGEPLLRKDFTKILAGLSVLDVQLSLTTNAILVDSFIDDFKKYGLSDINASLDTLHPDKFKVITKKDRFNRAFRNIELLLNEGFTVKINLVLIKDFNDDEIIDFIQLTKDRKLAVRFIEFMPFDGNRWNKSKLVSQAEILEKTYSYFGEENLVAMEKEPNFTARNYKIEGYVGYFGIISSVTNPFCDGCNRIRLTANGTIKNCLFSKTETPLLELFRKGMPLEPVIQKAIFGKSAAWGGMNALQEFETLPNHSNRSMIRIGG